MKKLQAGRRAQRRFVLLRTAQPAQVHERGSHVLAAVHEAGQHRARDVNLGTVEFGAALTGHEFGEVRPYYSAHFITPVRGNDDTRMASVLTHALMRRN